ncbi:MAG TPA: energy transducer TonB [Candidatus Binataceae bacterium]|nr:energy transducer TonB [Candidatus Binataceae bacterium]
MLILAMTPSARAQSAAPARPHVELEAKPPDEPSSNSTPDVETSPDAVPSPPSAGSNDQPIDADAVAHPPEIVTYVVPIYPPKARAEGVQGRVLLSVVVDESGKVEDNIQIVDSIPMLNGAAVDAVRQWSFTPARDDKGHAVRVQLQVPVPFVLK